LALGTCTPLDPYRLRDPESAREDTRGRRDNGGLASTSPATKIAATGFAWVDVGQGCGGVT
jgi:hypothetical protein